MRQQIDRSIPINLLVAEISGLSVARKAVFSKSGHLPVPFWLIDLAVWALYLEVSPPSLTLTLLHHDTITSLPSLDQPCRVGFDPSSIRPKLILDDPPSFPPTHTTHPTSAPQSRHRYTARCWATLARPTECLVTKNSDIWALVLWTFRLAEWTDLRTDPSHMWEPCQDLMVHEAPRGSKVSLEYFCSLHDVLTGMNRYSTRSV